MEDISYYEAQVQDWARVRPETASASTRSRGHRAGFRGGPRSGGRGRARGRAGTIPESNATSAPTLNDYGRQSVSSSVAPSRNGIPMAEALIPRKRGRTDMTTMHYSDDLSYDNEHTSGGPSGDQVGAMGSKKAASMRTGGPMTRREREATIEWEGSGAGDGDIFMDTDEAGMAPPPISLDLRRSAYTKEQLSGPATASGLPAFPRTTRPQELPSTSRPVGPTNQTQGTTHVDYIRDFENEGVAPKVAWAILERERPPPTLCQHCSRGGAHSPTWRCDCCEKKRYLCKECMGNIHGDHPYHRVKWFNGLFYADAWLRDAGVYLSLCQNAAGLSCPAAPRRPELPDGFYQSAPPQYSAAAADPTRVESPQRSPEPDPFDAVTGADSEFYLRPHRRVGKIDDSEAETASVKDRHPSEQYTQSSQSTGRASTHANGLPTTDHRGLRVFVICNDNGIHGLGVQFCSCPGAPSKDMQLIANAIYPASRTDPKSGFTFRCLQGFLVDNLESDASAESYARKLERLTEPENPDSAPNRYPELIRCAREFRVVIQLVEHGLSHQDPESWRPPGLGDMMYQCVVCPNPDENMRDDWRERKDSWAHFYSFNIDGNFEGQHTASRVPENNQPLFPGAGAFNDPAEAARAVQSGKDDKQLPRSQQDRAGRIPCHNHQAASSSGKTRSSTTDIKGIGTIVCARHGCFCAGATNNFSLGETQVPVDHDLNNVFKRCDFDQIKKMQILYDINCQYSVHLEDRFKAAGYTWPDFEQLMLGVGVWHIWGHVLECYSRFSPLYAYRFGIVDGEIVETLWSVLNEILGSCRGMSLAHREETINFKMSDMNWKKTLKSVRSLTRKVEKFTPLLHKRIAYLNHISESLDSADMEEWDRLRKDIELKRSQPMPSAERIADKQDDKGPRYVDGRLDNTEEAPNPATIETELLEEESRADDGVSLVKPILAAMKLQTEQVHLQIVDRQPAGNEDAILERTRWRARLASNIGRSNASMARLLDDHDDPGVGDARQRPPLPPVSLASDLFEPVAARGRVTRDLRSLAEYRPIDLPSTRWDGCQDYSSLSAIQRRALDVECRLRQAESRFILFKLRTSLVDQAYTFRKEVRSKHAGYHRSKRAYEKARDEGKVVRHQAQLYRLSRDRMLRCCSSQAAEKALGLLYQALDEDHIRCDTSTYDPTGDDKFELPWFWKLDRQAGEDDDTYVAKSFKLRWIQAKCAVDRCKEELIILPIEMERCILGYRHQAMLWSVRANRGFVSAGHRAYALRKVDVWTKLAAKAERAFIAVLGPGKLFAP